MLKKISLLSALLLAFSVQSVFAAECKKGNRADDFDFWEFIANNAMRTADAYAMKRNPVAFFAGTEPEVYYQYGGAHEGSYLVKILVRAGNGTHLAMLKPNFPFCGDPSNLDDERKDLFTVVVAKSNGKEF